MSSALLPFPDDPQARAVLDEVWAARLGTLHELGDGTALLRTRGVALRLNAAEAALVPLLDRFATLTAHAARLAPRAGGSTETVLGLLRGLIERGVLVTLRTFIGAPAQVAPAPYPILVARTCRRPAALAPLLDSLRDDSARLKAQRDLILIDDSADASEHETRRMAAAYAAQGAGRVRMMGDSEREALLAELARDLSPKELPSFYAMLCPTRSGIGTSARSTNWTTLLTAGGTFALLDDDFCFPYRYTPGAAASVDLRNSLAMRYHYAESQAELDALPAVDFDILAVDAQLLGRSPADLMLEAGVSMASLETATAASLAHLHGGTRITTVAQGLSGSLPVDSTVYANFFEPESLRSLWRAPYDHDLRMGGDCVWQGVRHPRILSYLLVSPQAADNRELLPFAGDSGRSDDVRFLAMVEATVRNSASVMLPTLVGHRQIDDRQRLLRSLQPSPFELNYFCASICSELAPTLVSNDRVARTLAVGAYFGDHATATDAVLLDRIRRFRQVQLGTIVHELQRSLVYGEQQGAPDQWRRYVEQMLIANRNALGDEKLLVNVLPAVRQAFERTAITTRYWPRLWQRMAEERPQERLLTTL